MSDHELLQSYARDQTQPAFAALVDRYLNLVYSAARRQVRSPELAEEVAQSVFVELARRAEQIPPAQPLAAWLYVVTRRTALNALRAETRRLVRETAAAEFAAMQTPSESWSKVEASIDEAMESLDDADRTALVLRFFQNLSLREVGAALGTSDDAAQKRVSRAVEQLRTFFLRRGVALTATGLATDLSAHALQIAPAGLGASISTAAALSGAAGSAAIATASKAIVMTTIQKSLVAAVFALALGAGVYEASVFARQTSDLDDLQQKIAALSTDLQQSHAQQVAAAGRLRSVETEIDARLPKPAPIVTAEDAALESQMKAWLANLDRLKQAFRDRPELAIPELKLLSDDTWFSTATSRKVESDEDLRNALASLRSSAENGMANRLQPALNAYVRAHDGALPDHVSDLLPFFDPAIEPELVQRYEMLRTGKLDDVPASDRMNLIAAKTPVDVEYDSYYRIGTAGFSNTAALSYLVGDGLRAFAQANNGRSPNTAADLLPFLKWPAPEAAVQKALNPPGRRRTP